MNNKPKENIDLGRTMVNKAVETAIATQVESAENIKINVDSQASQTIQGKAESIEFFGEKIVAFKDIQLEQINITSDNISLDLTQAILGKIAFEQPGNFKVKIIFTESDCDRLLNSEYVRILLQSLALKINHSSANFYLQQAKCHLNDNGKVSLMATAVLNREQQIKTAEFQMALQFKQDGAVIKFKGGKYLDKQSLDLDETVAILNKVRDLFYLRHFSNADLAIDITSIEIKSQQLTLQGNMQIKKLPDSLAESIKSVASEINNN
ncbi:LmeA family phospholipid-binding protein [Pleurocapsa sp. FMAR1]|uniref:LmeA family phospholipid-binding protein n=1 Tax=Pleurocapsa sp. FMAR1 TaxID=3040204 RepID=UPI0029C64E33|nr:DUF2993 domain-containing protein [Pleurocapsa sp. FMAR1]